MRYMLENFLNDLTGTSAVEFVLIAPLVAVLFVGTVDYGIFIREKMRLKNTTISVAEYIAKAGNDLERDTVAAAAYGEGVQDITLTSEFVCECADGITYVCPLDCGEGDYQRRYTSVTATGTFRALFPYPGVADSITLQSTSRSRVD